MKSNYVECLWTPRQVCQKETIGGIAQSNYCTKVYLVYHGGFQRRSQGNEMKGSMFDSSKAQDFNSFINQTDLDEIKLKGRGFTWIGRKR